MRVGREGMVVQLAVSLIVHEPQLSVLAIWWQGNVVKCLIRGLVPGSDLHDPASVLAGRDVTSQLPGKPNHLLDLLDRTHTLALLAPDSGFDADANVQAQSDRDVAQRQHRSHPG